jgi:hypothetical protein
MCDLYTGECVAMNNRSAPPEDNGEIVPGVPGTNEKGKGVEVSLQFASSMVGICFFGFLLTISSAVQYGKVVAFRRELRRQQQELEARELLVAAGDEEDAADGADPQGNADGDDEEDEAKLCKVCFCNKVDCALLKCGHIVCCRWCAKKLALCPICREPVSKLVRLMHVDGIRKALGEGDASSPQASTTDAPTQQQQATPQLLAHETDPSAPSTTTLSPAEVHPPQTPSDAVAVELPHLEDEGSRDETTNNTMIDLETDETEAEQPSITVSSVVVVAPAERTT